MRTHLGLRDSGEQSICRYRRRADFPGWRPLLSDYFSADGRLFRHETGSHLDNRCSSLFPRVPGIAGPRLSAGLYPPFPVPLLPSLRFGFNQYFCRCLNIPVQEISVQRLTSYGPFPKGPFSPEKPHGFARRQTPLTRILHKAAAMTISSDTGHPHLFRSTRR